MSRFLVLSILAAAAVVAARAGQAQSLTCRTVDGNTVCAGPGAVSCQTVNGRAVCAQGGHACPPGRGSTGCNDRAPIVEPQDDKSADNPDDADDDDASSPQPRLPGPVPGHAL